MWRRLERVASARVDRASETGAYPGPGDMADFAVVVAKLIRAVVMGADVVDATSVGVKGPQID